MRVLLLGGGGGDMGGGYMDLSSKECIHRHFKPLSRESLVFHCFTEGRGEGEGSSPGLPSVSSENLKSC